MVCYMVGYTSVYVVVPVCKQLYVQLQKVSDYGYFPSGSVTELFSCDFIWSKSAHNRFMLFLNNYQFFWWTWILNLGCVFSKDLIVTIGESCAFMIMITMARGQIAIDFCWNMIFPSWLWSSDSSVLNDMASSPLLAAVILSWHS